MSDPCLLILPAAPSVISGWKFSFFWWIEVNKKIAEHKLILTFFNISIIILWIFKWDHFVSFPMKYKLKQNWILFDAQQIWTQTRLLNFDKHLRVAFERLRSVLFFGIKARNRQGIQIMYIEVYTSNKSRSMCIQKQFSLSLFSLFDWLLTF